MASRSRQSVRLSTKCWTSGKGPRDGRLCAHASWTPTVLTPTMLFCRLSVQEREDSQARSLTSKATSHPKALSASSKRDCARWIRKHALAQATANQSEDSTVKIYRVQDGVIIQDGTGAYSFEADWDELINREDLARYLRGLLDSSGLPSVGGDFGEKILPPIVSQEVWAAGVTYHRSRTARIEESQDAGGGDFYDRVYMAERPELFFKATAHRVAGHGGAVRIRRDSHWNVPE